MYPYPSGDLHIGHWYIETPTDAIARFHRMHGENVFMPIGFDAFGLPAENAAIKNNINPRDWTMQNIEHDAQPAPDHGRGRSTGRYELVTCEPEYYRWNQWMFLRVPGGRPRVSPDVARWTGAPTTGRSRASRSRARTGTAGGVARRSRSATSSSGTSG